MPKWRCTVIRKQVETAALALSRALGYRPQKKSG